MRARCGATRRGWRPRGPHCDPARALPGTDERLAQRLALGLERQAAILQFGHGAEGFLEAGTRGAVARIGHFERPLEFREFGGELLHAGAALLGLGTHRVELRSKIHVRGAATRELGLFVRQPVFGLANALAHRFEFRVEFAAAGLQAFELGPFAAQRLLALEHAFVGVAVTADAQPVRADPDAVARDDRLARSQPRPHRERLGQRVRGDDAFEQRVEAGRALHACAQAVAVVAAAGGTLCPAKNVTVPAVRLSSTPATSSIESTQTASR